LFGLVLCAASVSLTVHATAAQANLHSCKLPDIEGQGRCGKYEVYENRAAKIGRKIGLNIVVLPALDPKHRAEPVFWLHGGPGAASTDTVGAAAKGGFLEGLRKRHDLVFVDQRGTGDSNGLKCDIGDDPNHLQVFFGEVFPSDAVAACRKKLEKIANLKLYSTTIAMDDLDEVRGALGYNKINIVGASYGSLASQAYMRQHGDHVRAVFILGVATPAIKQPLLFAAASQRTLELLFEDCNADKLCRKAFPKFREEFDAVLARLDHGPPRVRMIDPVSKKPTTVMLTRGNYVERLRLLLYTTFASSFLPLVVHSAYQNDFVPFEELAVAFNVGPEISRGMYFTVTCSEGVPFITEQEIADQSRGTFLGDYRVRVHQAACKQWPRADVSPDFLRFVRSDVPLLMVSGQEDGSTQPYFGEQAINYFTHGRQIEIAKYGHQLDSPCVWKVFQTFIERGSAQGLDTSCTKKIRRPPFATKVPKDFAIT